VPRRGVTVAAAVSALIAEERDRFLRQAVRQILNTAQRLGIDAGEIHIAIDAHLSASESPA
jgi:DNA-binding transcriptional regulator YhcF (GntR family)